MKKILIFICVEKNVWSFRFLNLELEKNILKQRYQLRYCKVKGMGMEMKKIIAFGCGSRFEKQAPLLEKEYSIIGISGKDNVEHNKYKYICPNHLKDYDYDYIVITSSYYIEIINFLVNEMAIEIEKIILDKVLLKQCNIFNGQYGEDAIILNIINLLNIDVSMMSYLELGTNNPISINNTYLLYQLGVRGVLVEPNPLLTNIIKCVRPEDRLITKAVDIHNSGKTTFYELNSSALGTIAIDKLEDDVVSKISTDFEIIDTFDVETITINDIFESMEATPTLLATDIEGLDYEVIKSIDFNKYRPRIILTELIAWGAKKDEKREMVEFLSDMGYRHFEINGGNGFFLMEEDFTILHKNIFKS
ncbi:MAG: FkbM family methyltransferase [Lachnospiraceae bacterium]|nr:FkbM family methyltransferase [Lachnospiraceae bacterium]